LHVAQAAASRVVQELPFDNALSLGLSCSTALLSFDYFDHGFVALLPYSSFFLGLSCSILLSRKRAKFVNRLAKLYTIATEEIVHKSRERNSKQQRT
jgi:hypothetical protein